MRVMNAKNIDFCSPTEMYAGCRACLSGKYHPVHIRWDIGEEAAGAV